MEVQVKTTRAVKTNFKGKRGPLTLDAVALIVSKCSGISFSELKTGSSCRRTMPARTVMIYFMRNAVPWPTVARKKPPFKTIGAYLNRDHTAVIYAINLLKDMHDVKDESFTSLFECVKSEIISRYSFNNFELGK
jgi:chromosomal replication initiation ATPase DnaA